MVPLETPWRNFKIQIWDVVDSELFIYRSDLRRPSVVKRRSYSILDLQGKNKNKKLKCLWFFFFFFWLFLIFKGFWSSDVLQEMV